MNKYLSIILIAFCAVITSCKKDKNQEVEPVYDVVGYWTLNSISTDLYYRDKLVLSNEDEFSDTQYIDNIEFKSNGTGSMSDKGRVFRRFSYRIEKNEIYFSSVTVYNGSTWIAQPNSMGIVAGVSEGKFALAYDTYLDMDHMRKNITFNRYRTIYHFIK